MIDPTAKAAADRIVADTMLLLGLVPQQPDPPPRVPLVRVSSAIALIEGAEAAYVAIELLDGAAPYDIELHPALLDGEATADDLDLGPPAIVKQGSEVVLWPLRAKADDLVEGTETARIKFTSPQVVAFTNDTVVVTITDTTPVQPPAGDLDPITFTKTPINAGDHIFSADWDKWFERYERGCLRRIFEAGQSQSITLYRKNSVTGGSTLNHTAFEYALLFGDVEVARTRPGGRYLATFEIVTDRLPAQLADAPYQLGLKQYDAQGNEVPLPLGAFVPTFVYLNRHGKLKEAPAFPSYATSFKCFRNGFNFTCARIPRHFIFNADGTWKEPEPRPLSPAETDFSTGNPRGVWTVMQPSSAFTCVQLNEDLKEDALVMTRDRTGAPAWEGEQLYTINEAAFAEKTRRAPYCDGPRGRARVCCPTDPQPARLGGGHVLEVRAMSRVDATGFKTVLFGKHVPGWPAIHYQDEALIEAESVLVGNWALVPVGKRGLNQSWTWVWVPRTVRKGSGAPIVNDGRTDGVKEPAHDLRPCMLVARPQPEHNDLLEAYFEKDTHQAEPELRVGIDGLNSPWGVDILDGGDSDDIVVLTEQSGDRISVWRRSVEGAYTKLYDVPLAHPQGIGIDRKTGDVYVGSRVDYWIYRFNLNDPTHALTKFAKVTTTAKSWYISVHVNNDPETGGTWICASTNNEAANYGNPETWLPDGTKVNPFPNGFAPHGWKNGQPAVYAMPARSGARVTMRGNSGYGLIFFRLKRPGDIDYSAAGYWDAAGFHRQFTDDRAKWEAEGFDNAYGPWASPSYAAPLPIGHADWCDRYIKVCRWGE